MLKFPNSQVIISTEPVVHPGEGPGGPAPPLFWVEKEKISEGRKASRARKPRPLP